MNVIKKDAAIANVGADDEFPGRFQVILSAPTLDRDGDTLLPDEWKQPLPDHITFDIDHGMSVATTVGSGAPHLDDQGRLIVDGTYSSLPRAQEARTLVNEGHIRTTSVAFMTEKSQQKDGATVIKRELLNGAFVAIPSNREALVLSSKGLKAGARNSASDAEHIQAIHDHAAALGAAHDTGDGASVPAGEKSFRASGRKTVAGSYEQAQNALSDAVHALYPTDDVWAYPVATFADTVVYRVSGGADTGQWQASYTLNGDGTAALGTPEKVNLVEQILPVGKSVRRKDADTTADSDAADLISATDAAIDQAIDLFATVDLTELPPAIAQAVALVQAADASIDELMELVGIPDPDEDATDSATDADAAAATENSAAAATSKTAAEDDAESIAVTDEALQQRMLKLRAAVFA